MSVLRDVAAEAARSGVRVGLEVMNRYESNLVNTTRQALALATAGYEGPITFESFSSAVVDPDLSTTLAVWRNLWDDGTDLAAQARRFVADGMHAARASRK